MITRRDLLLQSASMGAVVGTMGELGFFGQLPSLSADDVKRTLAPVAGDIEGLVKLIEDSPREVLLETMGDRIKHGTSYQEIITALMLAGVRGIRPRPVGFKFHAVLVVNSAHLASLAAIDRDRWLPLFWALDNFKSSQVRNAQEGNWRMEALSESRLPPAEHAVREFHAAMDSWNVEKADGAAAQLARIGSLNDVYEILWRYGARDFRDIGHKAIYVANSYRTMVTIGWRHAEPIIRSLAFALLDQGNDSNPAKSDHAADRPGRENHRKLKDIRTNWQQGRVAPEAVTEVLATLRSANPTEASDAVVKKLNAGIDPSCIWDAIFLFAGELMMRQPGIVTLHSATTANALAFGFRTTSNDETRRFLMLQAAAFMTMFRNRLGKPSTEPVINVLEPGQLLGTGQESVDDIFMTATNDRMAAARKMYSLLQEHPTELDNVMITARRLVFLKGNDSHDYKFSSAILEDFYNVSPAWRNRYLASGMFLLEPAGKNNSSLVERTRSAIG